MARTINGQRPSVLRHRSFDYRRTHTNPREHAFAIEWERENKITTGCGLGDFGTLQALVFDQRKAKSQPVSWWHVPLRFWVSNREAALAATVVQWLGTNCGMDFLRRCLAACGYKIVRDEEWRNAADCCPVCSGQGRRAHIDGRDVCGWCRQPWHNWNNEKAISE